MRADMTFLGSMIEDAMYITMEAESLMTGLNLPTFMVVYSSYKQSTDDIAISRDDIVISCDDIVISCVDILISSIIIRCLLDEDSGEDRALYIEMICRVYASCG